MLCVEADVWGAMREEAKDVAAMECVMIDFISSVPRERLRKRARFVDVVREFIRTCSRR